jgi:parallel beta-helix repeat protein
MRARLRFEQLESRNLPSTFFVATAGNDNAAGTSAAPWQTLRHAVDAIHPGDVIDVESGTYVGCRIGNSGTASAPCTLQAAPGAHVVVNAPGPGNKHGSDIEVENFSGTVSYWVIKGLEVTAAPTNAGIDIRVTTHITVRDCYCHHNQNWGIFLAFSDYPVLANNHCSYSTAQHGIYDSNSGDHPLITGNVCDHNAGCGIQLNADVSQGGDGIISYARITRNYLFANGSAGGASLNCDGVQYATIENNLIYNNFASGIVLYRFNGAAGSSHNLVVNNTVVMAASQSRWALSISNGSTNNVILNNIFLETYPGKGAITIDQSSLPGFHSDYNIVADAFNTDGTSTGTILTLSQWQAQTGQDKHSFVASASQLFVNPAANNYHLKSGSLAIDAGTSQGAPPPVDLDGLSRPFGQAFDIGCYEWHGMV